MATGFTGDFARLVPSNHIAQLLFSKTYVYVEKNDTFHLRFMESIGSEALLESAEPVESSTDYDTNSETNKEGSKLQILGHFVLSFEKGRSPEMPHLGWRVGRGSSKGTTNRNVDLLLAKPGDNRSKSLANIHMLFRFNRKSGFLMLRGASPKVPVEYSIGGSWRTLGYEKEQLLYQFSTMLRAGVCEYKLEYTIEENHRNAYFQRRDVFLEAVPSSNENISWLFQKLPGDSCVLRGRYLEFETKGSGAFGWITQGLDTETGDPVAIKELRINGRRSRLEIMAEVKMGTRFHNQRGLLPILDASCEHGHVDACCDLEKFYIFMPYAVSDLAINFWMNPNVSRNTKLHWLREPLEGIRTLHAMGIMHRDIRPKNMLLLSTEPPRASLCDYGKAVEVENSAITTIGPMATLAPEVWTVSRDGPYTKKIDMWAYGYAIAEILGYSTRDNTPISYNRHVRILSMLRTHCEKAPEDEHLVELVSMLLEWKPEKRSSANEALEHKCWNSIIQERKNDEKNEDGAKVETPQVKRVQLKDTRSKPNDTSTLTTDKTQEFSEMEKIAFQRLMDR